MREIIPSGESMACSGNCILNTYYLHDKMVASPEITNMNETLLLSSGSYNRLGNMSDP